jgi:hypothetical protein
MSGKAAAGGPGPPRIIQTAHKYAQRKRGSFTWVELGNRKAAPEPFPVPGFRRQEQPKRTRALEPFSCYDWRMSFKIVGVRAGGPISATRMVLRRSLKWIAEGVEHVRIKTDGAPIQ